MVLIKSSESSDNHHDIKNLNTGLVKYSIHSGVHLAKCNKKNYYMPSTFYIVKLPLALGNIFNLTESIMAQSHDDAKNPYWGLIMDFWHCLKVMTYKNRALFRVELG